MGLNSSQWQLNKTKNEQYIIKHLKGAQEHYKSEIDILLKLKCCHDRMVVRVIPKLATVT